MPSPTPAGLVKTTGGERYFVSSGHRNYLDLSRPASASVSPEVGRIENYHVQTEQTTDTPLAGFTFIPDDRSQLGGVVFLAQPPRIDGEAYVCPESARSKSEFVRRFQTCLALPNAVVNRPVRIEIYKVRLPGGDAVFVTDSITTLP